MSGTLINYKTENGIFKDFVEIVNEALKYFNIQGWQVRQLYQVLNVNILKPTIFLSIITNPQAGAQYRTNKKINGQIVETYNTKQEVKIRIHAARKRSIKDDENTLNGIDVLDLILRYLQSPKGIELLKSYKYAQYRASDLTNQNFLDDSENVELMPFFECEYLYTNSWTDTVPEVDKFTIDIHKI
jgi:hypothetical protein